MFRPILHLAHKKDLSLDCFYHRFENGLSRPTVFVCYSIVRVEHAPFNFIQLQANSNKISVVEGVGDNFSRSFVRDLFNFISLNIIGFNR